jgi:pimeloyl-ACP methyl ester carboxylesterase
LHQRFDLIGMDPRGTGLSTPIRCDPAVYNQPVSLFPQTKAQFDQLTAWASAFGKSCLRRTGALLGHVDTGSVARDMERLRRALGDGKLNFLGLSYGSHPGSIYAERYPKRIRAMALDGIANHSTSTNTLFSDTASAHEDTFNRFAAGCAQTSTCPLRDRDVAAMLDSLVARADQQPIPAPECADGSCRPTVTGGELRMNLFNLLLAKGLSPHRDHLQRFRGQSAARPRPRTAHPGCERGLAGNSRLHPLARSTRPPPPHGHGARRSADPAGGLDARPVDPLRVRARDARPHRGFGPAHARR